MAASHGSTPLDSGRAPVHPYMMTAENPVLLITSRPLLAGLLAAHLPLPAPYRLEQEAGRARPALLIVDSEGKGWKEVMIRYPATAFIQLGGAPDVGAAHHFPFPLSLSALAVATQSLLPHLSPESAPVKVGSHAFFSLEQRLLWNGRNEHAPLPLTQKEAELLDRLLREEGQPINREQLLAEIWLYEEGAASHTVETHLYRLRQKLKEAGAQDVRIEAQAGALRLAVNA